MTKKIFHSLPREPGDSGWFHRQNKFEQGEILRQVAYKRRHWPDLPDGHSGNRPQHYYPHILPEANERLAFAPSFADEVLEYMDEDRIALHTELLNLKSSQAACFNFLYPLRKDKTLGANVLRHFLDSFASIEDIQFEYTGSSEATNWLGEPRSGRRGQNRTSIDAAIFWKDQSGNKNATLVEWKYTERNFGRCSAYAKANRNERLLCRSLDVKDKDKPEKICLLTTGKRHRNRRYWQHINDAGINLNAFHKAAGCPFQGPFYQLMRQYQLAAFLRLHEGFRKVEVISIGFSGNEALQRIPRYLQPMKITPHQSLIEIWNQALHTRHFLRHIYIEKIIGIIDQLPNTDRSWRAYILERYGV